MEKMAHLREERKGNQQEFANVTNLVALPTHCLLHHTTSARHPQTTFPITHCTDITQLISLITHCTHHTADFTDHSLHSSHSWLHWSHTQYKPWTSSLSLPSIVCHCQYCRAASLCFPVDYLDRLHSSDCLLPAFWPCLSFDIISVCRLHRPLHCPCLCLSLAYVTLITVDRTLPVWPPFV